MPELVGLRRQHGDSDAQREQRPQHGDQALRVVAERSRRVDVRTPEHGAASRRTRSIALAGYPRASFAAAMVALWVVVAALLHCRRIYIRA